MSDENRVAALSEEMWNLGFADRDFGYGRLWVLAFELEGELKKAKWLLKSVFDEGIDYNHYQFVSVQMPRELRESIRTFLKLPTNEEKEMDDQTDLNQKLANWKEACDRQIGDTMTEINRRREQNLEVVLVRDDLNALIDYLNANQVPIPVKRAIARALSWNPSAQWRTS